MSDATLDYDDLKQKYNVLINCVERVDNVLSRSFKMPDGSIPDDATRVSLLNNITMEVEVRDLLDECD